MQSPNSTGIKQSCVVPGCRNIHSTRTFPNPTQHEETFNIWLQRINNIKLFAIPKEFIYRNYRICDRHYRDVCKGLQKTIDLPMPKGKSSDTPVQGIDLSFLKGSELVFELQPNAAIDLPTDSQDTQLVENAEPLLNLDLSELQNNGEDVFLATHRTEIIEVLSRHLENQANFNESDGITYVSPQELEQYLNQNLFAIYDIIETVPEAPEKPFFKSVKSYLVDKCCMKDVCRICFRTILSEEMIRLYKESRETNRMKSMLKLVLPDLDLEIYPNAVVCVKCKELVEYSFQLKELWLTTEQKLQKIIEKKKGEIKRDADLIIVAKAVRPDTVKETVQAKVVPVTPVKPKVATKATQINFFELEAMQKSRLAKARLDDKKCEDKSVKTVTEQVRPVDNLNSKTVTEKDAPVDDLNRDTDAFNTEELPKIESYTTVRYTRELLGKGPYMCEKCGRILKSMKSIRRHLKRHATPHKRKKQVKEETNALCDICGKMLTSRGVLLHKLWHKNLVHECAICNKMFKFKTNLELHVRQKHLKLVNYQCHICGKQFIWERSLHIHMHVHNRKFRQTCNICDKKFLWPSNLKKHMRRHLGGKFICELCGKSTKYEESLRKHVEVFHEGKGGFTCDECGKVCFKKCTWERHMIMTHGWFPNVVTTNQ